MWASFATIGLKKTDICSDLYGNIRNLSTGLRVYKLKTFQKGKCRMKRKALAMLISFFEEFFAEVFVWKEKMREIARAFMRTDSVCGWRSAAKR